MSIFPNGIDGSTFDPKGVGGIIFARIDMADMPAQIRVGDLISGSILRPSMIYAVSENSVNSELLNPTGSIDEAPALEGNWIACCASFTPIVPGNNDHHDHWAGLFVRVS